MPAWCQETHLLVITGVAGDEEHAKQFHNWATRFIDAAKKKDGVLTDDTIYLARQDRARSRANRGRSTKRDIEKAFADLAAKAQPNDEVFVLLIGHGSFDGKMAAFNLPGPDLTAADYARLVGKIQRSASCSSTPTSSSGGFLQALAGTRAHDRHGDQDRRRENEPRFPQFFVEAYNDRRGRSRSQWPHLGGRGVRVRARRRSSSAYQKAGTMLTEHATLDDGSEGKLAATVFSSTAGRVSANLDMSNPQVRELVEEQRRARTAGRRAQAYARRAWTAAEYDQQLEKLLTALALKTQAIQQLEAKK